MNEQKFYELMGQIDPEIIEAADKPVPFRKKRGFKIMLIAAVLAFALLITPVAGAFALVSGLNAGKPAPDVDQSGEQAPEGSPNAGGLVGELFGDLNWGALGETLAGGDRLSLGEIFNALLGKNSSETIGHTVFVSSVQKDGTVKIVEIAPDNTETVLTIPDTLTGGVVTAIGAGAFKGAEHLTHVSLPDTVSVIEEGAFYGCSNLISIDLGDGVREIGEEAFAGCTSLMTIDLPRTLTKIGNYAFAGCGSLQHVTIRATLTDGDYMFANSGLLSVTIAKGVTEIPAHAFAGTPLTEIVIPASVTRIEKAAFLGCKQLQTVTLNEGLQIIDEAAFSFAAISEITIPSTVTSFAAMDFAECKNLTSVIFAGDVPSSLFMQEHGDGVYLPQYTVYYTLGAKGFDELAAQGFVCEPMPCTTDSVVADCGFEIVDFYKATILGTSGQSFLEQDVTVVDNYAESKKMRSLLTKLDNDISYGTDYFEDFTVIIVEVTHSSSEEILGVAGVACADVIYSGVLQQNPTDYHLYPVIKVRSSGFLNDDILHTYIAIEIAKTDKNFVDSHIYAYNVNPNGMAGSAHHDALPYGK